MRTFLRPLILLVASATLAFSAEAEWMTDFAAAKVKAKEEEKAILLNFTGSDWCGWCIKLHKEVFSKKEFIEWADENLVLVTVDFPQEKKLPAAEAKQNEKLGAKYEVEGYPTIKIVDADGKELGESGYEEGGPKNYIKILSKIIKEAE